MSETAVITSNVIVGILTIAAIIIGPIAALRIQARIENKREATNRKMWVFKTLMMYRATPLAPVYVQALNLIDVEFDSTSKDDKAIRDAWKELLDSLGDTNRTDTFERRIELTTELLSRMGKRLGYDFDKVYLKKHAYYPTGLGNIEEEQNALRKKLLNVLDGKARIPMAVLKQDFPDLADGMKQPLVMPAQKRELGAGEND